MFRAQLRSGFFLLAMLFEPNTALLLQTRPGSTAEDVFDAAITVQRVEVSPSHEIFGIAGP
jgi:hypothetical protein